MTSSLFPTDKGDIRGDLLTTCRTDRPVPLPGTTKIPGTDGRHEREDCRLLPLPLIASVLALKRSMLRNPKFQTTRSKSVRARGSRGNLPLASKSGAQRPTVRAVARQGVCWLSSAFALDFCLDFCSELVFRCLGNLSWILSGTLLGGFYLLFFENHV